MLAKMDDRFKGHKKLRPWEDMETLCDKLSTSPFLDVLELTTLPLKFTTLSVQLTRGPKTQ